MTELSVGPAVGRPAAADGDEGKSLHRLEACIVLWAVTLSQLTAEILESLVCRYCAHSCVATISLYGEQ